MPGRMFSRECTASLISRHVHGSLRSCRTTDSDQRDVVVRAKSGRGTEDKSETKAPKRPLKSQSTACRDKMRARIPANSGLFTKNREISV
jgi:hypothetical protein